MEVLKKSKEALKKAAQILKNGGVIICPTDTVYGFLADAQNKKAVDKIYKIKKRPRSKPLPIFVKDLKMAKELAEINKEQEKVLKKYWPGKYTFVLKCRSQNTNLKMKIKNKKLYGVSNDTIAIRIPNYKFLNSLLEKINKPLVQTSVNISAEKPLNKAAGIIRVFGKNELVGLIIDAGSLGKAKPSEINDFTEGVLTKVR